MAQNGDNAFVFELYDRVHYLGEKEVVGQFEEKIVAGCGLRVTGCGLRVAGQERGMRSAEWGVRNGRLVQEEDGVVSYLGEDVGLEMDVGAGEDGGVRRVH